MEGKWNKITNYYVVFFTLIMLVYCSVNVPQPTGEWDDYSLPVASILNDYDFGISDEDVIKYKQFFPEWADYIDNRSLSGYIEKSSNEEMTWYFPTYAIICIPVVLILQLLNLPAIYAFPYTNLALLLLALRVVFLVLKTGEKRKFALILLLSVNPIVFYISWTSAEVCIYSFIIMALVCWYNRYYMRAATLLSVAGMLNPTIMSIGFVMIFDYLIKIIRNKKENLSWKNVVKENVLNVIKYACCYIIGLIPMIYNYVNTGHINLTASYDTFTIGKETIMARFASYLFDLNYGIFPYFTVILILAIGLSIYACFNRHLEFLKWIIAFIITVIGYSCMVHINCGMSGIARYNVWGVTLIIFAVCLYFDEVCRSLALVKIMRMFLVIGVALTGMIVFNYGPYLASNVSYLDMTPIASYVLEKFPVLYKPLPSTFNNRVVHVDGGYMYETPIIYIGNDGYVRKILASNKDTERLRETCLANSAYQQWLDEKISQLTDEESYISIPAKYEVVLAPVYDLEEPLIFYTAGYNVGSFVAKGLSHRESWGSWTDGTEFEMRFRTKSKNNTLVAKIDCSVYNGEQDIAVYVNDEMVYCQNGFSGGVLKFSFDNPGYMEVIDVKIKIPDAISPSEFGYADKRILGLGISKISFYDALEEISYQLGEVIYFDAKNNNADRYIVKGIRNVEDWGSWTDGKEFEMQFSIPSDSEKIHAEIYCGVYNEEQDVMVYLGGEEIYRCNNFRGGVLQFDFFNPRNADVIDLRIVLPNAISPSEFGYTDTRVLGLGITQMIFSEVK